MKDNRMITQPICLLIDDEQDILGMLERTLKRDLGIKSLKANTVNAALDLITTAAFSLCLTDMSLPDTPDGNIQTDGGMEIIRRIHQKDPTIPIIVMTAHANTKSTAQSLKLGAFDYISKPISVIKLRHVIKNALEATELTLVKNTEKREYVANNLIGDSKQMRELRAKLETIAYTQVPIHIKGESGTGKEVVARAIHRLSSRADKPFVAVNCGAISSELMESEFFGHKKGSFTGATQNKEGLFQTAEGGFLFLDEIGDLPLPMQAKLLRAIQEKQVRPVGSNQEIPVDVRILSATHRDLNELVKMGSFREDLSYRINVIELCVPPLRERISDIPLLAENILHHVSATLGIDPALYLHPDAIATLQHYHFDGNVRELQNILERAATVCQSSEILLQDLQLPNANLIHHLNNINALATDISAATEDTPSTTDALTAALMQKFTAMELNEFLAEMEKAKIAHALEQSDGNLTLAAKLLGVSRASLRYRVTRYDMNFKDIKE